MSPNYPKSRNESMWFVRSNRQADAQKRHMNISRAFITITAASRLKQRQFHEWTLTLTVIIVWLMTPTLMQSKTR